MDNDGIKYDERVPVYMLLRVFRDIMRGTKSLLDDEENRGRP